MEGRRQKSVLQSYRHKIKVGRQSDVLHSHEIRRQKVELCDMSCVVLCFFFNSRVCNAVALLAQRVQ